MMFNSRPRPTLPPKRQSRSRSRAAVLTDVDLVTPRRARGFRVQHSSTSRRAPTNPKGLITAGTIDPAPRGRHALLQARAYLVGMGDEHSWHSQSRG